MSEGAERIFAGASWIASANADGPLPMFRKSFQVDRVPDRADIAICGLGQFELHVNGEKVGDDVMEPVWSNYRKSCLYVVHDIAKHLRPGENVIDVMLGNGMYSVIGTPGRYKKFKGSFGQAKLIAAAQIGETRIVTDGSWQCAAGPITFSCIYGGEDYDARLEEAQTWTAAVETDGPGGALIEQDCPPIRVMRAFEPMKVTEPRPGVRVYDLDQNFSGWPSIRLRGGEAGTTVKLITGELLDDAGLVTQKNSGSPVWFSYTASGSGEETWHPRFSYTGFRYVQLEGDIAAVANLEAHFIHASLPVVGQFSCSNELLNRIHDLILAAILSNMQSVLTDCPHREKLGWLEQAHLMAPSIMANFDASRYFAKICRDMREAQLETGCVPTIAPQYTTFKPPWDVFNDSPEWGSAMVLVPWHVFTRYGDTKILDENYDAMRRYVAFLGTRANADGIIDYGLGDWYDIGPGEPGVSKLTSKALTATAIYFRDLIVMEAVATTLAKTDDAKIFAAKAADTRGAFNERVADRGASQAACAMPLALDLVEAEHRAAFLNQLIADIRKRDNHITAGDIGFHFVVRALAEAGRSDVIFDLLTRTDPPSYGAILARGATTLTEAWDANPKNSQNHLMLGHAEAWFHEWLAGIQIDMTNAPSKQIIIRPTPVGDVKWVRASHDSVPGKVEVHWERNERRFALDVVVPTDATVCLPDGIVRTVDAGSHRFETGRLP
jgi:alpha-L-rhamnosidase